jgi:hypothetical protein
VRGAGEVFDQISLGNRTYIWKFLLIFAAVFLNILPAVTSCTTRHTKAEFVGGGSSVFCVFAPCLFGFAGYNASWILCQRHFLNCNTTALPLLKRR